MKNMKLVLCMALLSGLNALAVGDEALDAKFSQGLEKVQKEHEKLSETEYIFEIINARRYAAFLSLKALTNQNPSQEVLRDDASEKLQDLETLLQVNIKRLEKEARDASVATNVLAFVRDFRANELKACKD